LDNETFLFEDFFIPADDPGVETSITVNGREIPLRVKRGLSLGDREAARAVATKMDIDLMKGTMKVDSFDEGVFTIELLFRCLVSWPFTKDGVAVPITRDNIRALSSSAADEMAKLVQLFVGGNKEEALAPFEKPSDAA
jgi:hypothetical protein